MNLDALEHNDNGDEEENIDNFFEEFKDLPATDSSEEYEEDNFEFAGHYMYNTEENNETVIEIKDHAPFFHEHHIDADSIMNSVDWGTLPNNMELFVKSV